MPTLGSLITYLVGRAGIQGKTKLQKVIYFAEVSGLQMPANYRMHLYGPYSREVALECEDLLAQGVLSQVAQGLGLGPLGEQSVKCAETELGEALSTVETVLERFGHLPLSDLELFGTIHFVAWWSHESSRDSVIERVERLKGTKFSPDEVAQCFDKLSEWGMLPH